MLVTSLCYFTLAVFKIALWAASCLSGVTKIATWCNFLFWSSTVQLCLLYGDEPHERHGAFFAIFSSVSSDGTYKTAMCQKSSQLTNNLRRRLCRVRVRVLTIIWTGCHLVRMDFYRFSFESCMKTPVIKLKLVQNCFDLKTCSYLTLETLSHHRKS